jgi:hypothetical protein
MLTIFGNFYIKKIKEINGGILEDWYMECGGI